MDKFQEELQKQKSEVAKDDIQVTNGVEDMHAAEQIDNKRIAPSERGKESGIVISKNLNLPNYDLTLKDVEV